MRILAPADLKNLFSFPRYGRLKLELLCEEISHIKFGLCNKYRIYKGLNTSARAGRWQWRWWSQPCQHSSFFHPTATPPRWNKNAGGNCLKNTIGFSSWGCWCWKVQRKREGEKNVKMKLKILIVKKESITGSSCGKVKVVYLQRRMHRGCCCERGRTLAVAFCRHSLLMMASWRLKHTCLKVSMFVNINKFKTSFWGRPC